MFDGTGGRPSKELFELVFEHAAIGLSITQLDGRMYPNQAFADMLGYARDELAGKSWAYVTHPEDVRAGEEAIARLLAEGGGTVKFAKRYIHKSGRTVWGEVDSKLHRDATGAPRFFLTSIRDITTRKALERELMLRNTILATEHEAFLDGILVVDGTGRVLSHNRRFVEICAIPKEALDTGNDEVLLDVAVEQLVSPEEFREKVAWLYANPHATSRDEIALKDGRYLERLSAPMIASNGERLGRVWFFRDVSERKRTEATMRERLEELERWQDVMLDREDRVSALKLEINELCQRLGESLRYPSQEADAIDASDPSSRTTIEVTRFRDPGEDT